jgi:hypothetical protein
VHVVTGQRQPVAAQQDVDLEPLAQRVEDAVPDRRELRGDVVRNVENLFRQASFSFTSWLRRRLAAPTDKGMRALPASPPRFGRSSTADVVGSLTRASPSPAD